MSNVNWYTTLKVDFNMSEPVALLDKDSALKVDDIVWAISSGGSTDNGEDGGIGCYARIIYIHTLLGGGHSLAEIVRINNPNDAAIERVRKIHTRVTRKYAIAGCTCGEILCDTLKALEGR